MSVPSRTKTLIIGLIAAVFITSLLFGYIAVTDPDIPDDESRTLMFAVIFLTVFLSLNLILMFVGLKAYAATRKRMTARQCTECNASIPVNAAACPQCGSVYKDKNTYLDPKEEDEPDVRPKR